MAAAKEVLEFDANKSWESLAKPRLLPIVFLSHFNHFNTLLDLTSLIQDLLPNILHSYRLPEPTCPTRGSWA
jgi:hypothetical protein